MDRIVTTRKIIEAGLGIAEPENLPTFSSVMDADYHKEDLLEEDMGIDYFGRFKESCLQRPAVQVRDPEMKKRAREEAIEQRARYTKMFKLNELGDIFTGKGARK